MNRDRWTRWLYPTLGFFLLGFSLYILNQELSRYDPQDILQGLSSIGNRKLVSALGFTLLSCVAIGCYDLVAFRCFQYHLNLKRIFFTTFITYAVSNTTGFTLLIGGGIRYRFYSLWGVPPKAIAKITALGNITFWLGLLTLTGITFLINPLQLPNSLNLNLVIIRCLGIIALLLVGSYLYQCSRRKRFKVKGKILCFPKLTTSLAQIVIFSLDWALAAAVLYCLIPDYLDKSYLNFFKIYLIAMAASIISNVPGGIGVFETVIIFLLPKTLAVPDVLSSLLVYRGIRFLLPLAIALLCVFCFEIRRRL
ncbi:MAG: lysylphosphatidylglycerol synthase domain-containing protein [Pleurocapsa sp. MO_226.B13]|nr:lysylphosphatidylglycerol synthase domain-containing protein [Pleurocapsa sp. MO_226.B13]